MAIDKIFDNASVDGIADNLFKSVSNSVSEVKAMQQRKAAENVQLVIQALKKIESDLRQTNEEVANELATRIASIKDGKDGKDGNNAKDGRDGRPGRDGAKGDKGDRGLDGRNGVDGKDGVSVTDAKIDFDGSLIISLSTGQEINVGEVVSSDLADKIQIISTMSTNGAVGIKDEGSSISTGVKNINFVGATVTATNSGDDVTVNVSAGTGTVTSVAATVPAFLSVAGSPITTTGTLAISLSGTALPVANGGTGITSFGTGVATFLGTPSSANLAAALTDETGTGSAVFATSPTLVTPALGTPSSGVVTNLTGTASININGTVGATTPAAGTFTSLSDSGNLTFTGTGNRITGDFSNATVASRVMFQTSTVNSTTNLGLVPNGTGTASVIDIHNASDATNAAKARMSIDGTAVFFVSSINGTGTFLPMLFLTGGSERMRLDTSGNLGLGTTSPAQRLDIRSASTPTIRVQETGSGGDKRLELSVDTSGVATISAPQSAQVLTFNTVGSERARIDSSGNVGIGTNSPGHKLSVTTTTGGGFNMTNGVDATLRILLPTTGITYDNVNFGYHAWLVGGSEKMRIDSSGNLLVGATSSGGAGGMSVLPLGGGAGTSAIQIFNKTNTASDSAILFRVSGTTVSGISYTSTVVTYGTVSDYRLKTVIGAVADSGSRIDALEPIEYTWNSNGQRTRGFLAHKFQEVYADSVTGTKDALDTDGNPVYQGMQAGSTEVIADLVAEIQSLRKRLTALESKEIL